MSENKKVTSAEKGAIAGVLVLAVNLALAIFTKKKNK
jgi:hypothetical protein